MKDNLPYPDNLQNTVFGDELPVPADAAETLEILMDEDDLPLFQLASRSRELLAAPARCTVALCTVL